MRQLGPKPETLTIAHFAAAWVWLFVAMMAGMVMGAQLAVWRLFPGVEILSPGRCWTVHTNFMLWGFLCNLTMGLLHDCVSQATGRAVLSRTLSWFVFAMLQFVVLVDGIGIIAGYSDTTTWAEYPSFILPMLLATLTLAGINFGVSALGSDRAWPPALWCFIAAGIAIIFSLAAELFLPHQDTALMRHLIVLGAIPAAVGVFLWLFPQKEIWPRRWLLLGGIAAAVLIVQCVIQMMAFPSPLELRQWIERNGYTILLGVLPIWMTGAMLATISRVLGSEWKSHPLLQAHFWLTVLGLLLLLTDLLPAGLVPGGGHPGAIWNPLASGADVFWKVQMAAGASVLAGQICLIVNFIRTWRFAEARHG